MEAILLANHQRWRKEDMSEISKRLKEVAHERGVIFKGFSDGEWLCGYTLLKLYCHVHGIWETTNLSNFLNLGYGCPDCKRTSRDEKARLSNKDATDKFNKEGRFPTHTFVRDFSKQNKHRCYVYWDVYCSLCAEDELSKAGVSDGWFKSSSSHLRNGKLPCRCSSSYRATEEELRYLLEKACNNKNFHIVKINKNLKGRLVKTCKVEYLCENGYVNKTPISKLLMEGRGCNSCRLQNSVRNGYYKGKDSEEDYLYMLVYPFFIKIGRSFEFKSRTRFHILRIGEDPIEVLVFKGNHRSIYDMEQKLLENRESFLEHTTETLPANRLHTCLNTIREDVTLIEVK